MPTGRADQSGQKDRDEPHGAASPSENMPAKSDAPPDPLDGQSSSAFAAFEQQLAHHGHHDQHNRKSISMRQGKSILHIGGAQGGGGHACQMFPDKEEMKHKLHEDMESKPYNVEDLYWPAEAGGIGGAASAIARHDSFQGTTLAMIALNAVWIGIETDHNTAPTLAEADLYIQFGEHLFCVFFSVELLVRFCAFESKISCLIDNWFKFDTALVLLMVVETWIMPLVTSGGSVNMLGDMSLLRLLRLMRLSRMARLMRAIPELMIIFRGIAAATRSVSTALILLVLIMYVFAIIFKVQLGADPEMEESFGSIPFAMWTLLLSGVFLDDVTDVINNVQAVSPAMSAVFVLFIVVSAIMIMNMLIGILCEVISAVAEIEKEKLLVDFVKSRLLEVLQELDVDHSKSISKRELMKILQHTQALEALEDLGVESKHLLSLSDTIFDQEFSTDGTPKDLTWSEFMELLLQLRSGNQVSVGHLMDLRKFIRRSFRVMMQDFHKSIADLGPGIHGREPWHGDGHGGGNGQRAPPATVHSPGPEKETSAEWLQKDYKQVEDEHFTALREEVAHLHSVITSRTAPLSEENDHPRPGGDLYNELASVKESMQQMRQELASFKGSSQEYVLQSIGKDMATLVESVTQRNFRQEGLLQELGKELATFKESAKQRDSYQEAILQDVASDIALLKGCFADQDRWPHRGNFDGPRRHETEWLPPKYKTFQTPPDGRTRGGSHGPPRIGRGNGGPVESHHGNGAFPTSMSADGRIEQDDGYGSLPPSGMATSHGAHSPKRSYSPDDQCPAPPIEPGDTQEDSPMQRWHRRMVCDIDRMLSEAGAAQAEAFGITSYDDEPSVSMSRTGSGGPPRHRARSKLKPLRKASGT